MPRSPIGIFRNERTRSTPLDPKLMFWCVSYYLGAFGTVFCPTTLSAKRVNWCNCSCHKVTLEFFATDAPDPPHWTLKFCFRAICTILVHLGLFGCHTTLNAKRVKLVQKFVSRSLVGILATNTPDPPHWTLNSCFGVFCIIWVHLGLFGCVTTLTVKRVKLVKNFVPSEFFATNAPDPPHWTLNSSIGLFSTIWVHLGLFGCLRKLGAKRDRTGAKVHATKSHRNFSQLKHPTHPIGP